MAAKNLSCGSKWGVPRILAASRAAATDPAQHNTGGGSEDETGTNKPKAHSRPRPWPTNLNHNPWGGSAGVVLAHRHLHSIIKCAHHSTGRGRKEPSTHSSTRTVAVVLAAKDGGEAPQLGDVERLVQLTLIGRTVTVQRHRQACTHMGKRVMSGACDTNNDGAHPAHGWGERNMRISAWHVQRYRQACKQTRGACKQGRMRGTF